MKTYVLRERLEETIEIIEIILDLEDSLERISRLEIPPEIHMMVGTHKVTITNEGVDAIRKQYCVMLEEKLRLINRNG